MQRTKGRVGPTTPPGRWPMTTPSGIVRAWRKLRMANRHGFATDPEFDPAQLFVVALTLLGEHAMSADGLITTRSNFGPEETMKRFEAEVRAKGMTFAHIDHAAGAAAAGMRLRPTDLLIFGGAKGGTPLMQSVQRLASTCRSRRWSGKTRPARRFFPTTIPAISRAGTNSVTAPSLSSKRCQAR